MHTPVIAHKKCFRMDLACNFVFFCIIKSECEKGKNYFLMSAYDDESDE